MVQYGVNKQKNKVKVTKLYAKNNACRGRQ
jgi:hypothetical protein